jgi:predicted chitinase
MEIDPKKLQETLKKELPNAPKGVLDSIIKEVAKNKKSSKGSQRSAAYEKAADAAAAAAREGKGLIGGAFASASARSEMAKEYAIAIKGTTGRRQAFFEGLLGKDLGDLFKNLGLEKMESADRVKEARAKFDLDKKNDKDKIKSVKKRDDISGFKNLVRDIVEIKKNVRALAKFTLVNRGFKSEIDPKTGKTLYRDAKGKFAKSSDATFAQFKETGAVKRKNAGVSRTDALSAAIAADEDPMIRIADSIESILKTLGEPENKTIHKKLDDLLDKNDGGLGFGDLIDFIPGRLGGGRRGGGRRGGRRGLRGGRRGGVRRGGGLGGMGGLLGAAAGGFLAYQAVDSFRDPNLEVQGGEALKEQAMEAKTPEEKKIIADQIAAEKKDIKIQAAASAAGVAGAAGGAVAANKIGQTAVVKNVKSKAWDLFVNFVKKKAPKLFAKIGARLALAGGMAVVPGVGWVASAVTVVGSLWMAYDLYSLWSEFSALSDAEKQLYDPKVQTTKSTGEVKPAPATKPPASPVSAANRGAMPGSSTVSTATASARSGPVTAATGGGGGGGGFGSRGSIDVSSTEAGITQSLAETDKSVSSDIKNMTGSPINIAMQEAGLNNKFAQIALLANIKKESNFKPISENMNYKNTALDRIRKIFGKRAARYDDAQLTQIKSSPTSMGELMYGKDTSIGQSMGNTEPGDGFKYRGRGYIQLTGKNNYRFYGKKVGEDLVKNPDLANDPTVAAKISASYVMTALKGKQDFADQKTANYAVTKAIGGNLDLTKGYGAEILAKVNAYSGESGLVASAGAPASGGGGGGGGGGSTTAAPPAAAPSMVAAAPSAAPSAAPPAAAPSMVAAAPSTAAPSMVAAAPSSSAQLTPVVSTTGNQVAQGSAQLASSQMTAQAAPPTAAPMVVNNSSGGGKQATPPPNQPMQKASTRSDENAFNRAISRDFAHPTSFTSAIIA